MCARVLSLFNHVPLLVTLWTVACQAPQYMEFNRQEYWSGLPCPPPGNLPNPGVPFPALADGFFTTSASWEAHQGIQQSRIQKFQQNLKTQAARREMWTRGPYKTIHWKNFKGLTKQWIPLAIKLVCEWPGTRATIQDHSLALSGFPPEQVSLSGTLPSGPFFLPLLTLAVSLTLLFSIQLSLLHSLSPQICVEDSRLLLQPFRLFFFFFF